jgi:hypothetical protein
MTDSAATSVPGAVSDFCAATAANDLDAIMATLTEDAELVSPLSGRLVFRGRDDLRLLLGAVYATLRDLRWEPPIVEGRRATAVAVSRFAGLRLDDAMLFELSPEGKIARLRPHLRPWLATTLFTLGLGPRMAPHAGVMLRAARRG